MNKPINIGRFGSSSMYLGPNVKAPAMRYRAAKAEFALLAGLRSELDAELAFSKATGLGDHAKIDRLINAIHAVSGRMPWEIAA